MMRGVKTVGACVAGQPTGAPRKRLEDQEKNFRERQVALKSLGKRPVKLEDICTTDARSTTKSSAKTDGNQHRDVYETGRESPRFSVDTKQHHAGVRAKPREISREVPPSRIGHRAIGRTPSESNGRETAEDLHGHFKKEFIEKLATKARSRQRIESSTAGSDDKLVHPVEKQSIHRRHCKTEVGVNSESLGIRSVSLIQKSLQGKSSSPTTSTTSTPRLAASHESKQRSSPGPARFNEEFRETICTPKSKKANQGSDKHDDYGTSLKIGKDTATKGLIYIKDFEPRIATRTKAHTCSCGQRIPATNDDKFVIPGVSSSTGRHLQPYLDNSASLKIRKLDVLNPSFAESQSLDRILAENMKWEGLGAHALDGACSKLQVLDHVAQIGRNVSTVLPKKSMELGGVVGLTLPRESGISKDSFNTSTIWKGSRQCEEEDPRPAKCRAHGTAQALSLKQLETRYNGIQSDHEPLDVHQYHYAERRRQNVKETQSESSIMGLPETENMLRLLKVAAAVDQAHFLRALQENGAMPQQTSLPAQTSLEGPNRCGDVNVLCSHFHSTINSTNVLLDGKGMPNKWHPRPLPADSATQKAQTHERFQSNPAGNSSSSCTRQGGAVSVRRFRSGNILPAETNSPRNVQNNRPGVRGGGLSQSGDRLIGRSRSSTESEDNNSSTMSGGSETNVGAAPKSVLQILMRKVSSRTNANLSFEGSQGTYASSSSGSASPSSVTPRSTTSDSEPGPQTSRTALHKGFPSRKTADYAIQHQIAESQRPSASDFADSTFTLPATALSNPREGGSWQPTISEDLCNTLPGGRKCCCSGSPGPVVLVLEQTKASAVEASPAAVAVPTSASADNDSRLATGNSLRIDVRTAGPANIVATSPSVSKFQFRNSESIVESCRITVTTEPPFYKTSSQAGTGANPLSPGSDDSCSGSETSVIEQPSATSPISVLYSNARTPFQEVLDSRLKPLEHKLQDLHERIHRSRRNVSNKKKANLEKIKRAKELESSAGSLLGDLRNPKLLSGTTNVLEVSLERAQPELRTAVPEKPPNRHARPEHIIDVSEVLLDHTRSEPACLQPRKLFQKNFSTTKDENFYNGATRDSISTALEIFDLRSVPSWTEERKWDLVYVRDVLVASSFGQNNFTMIKWYSVTEPMDPRLFENLEAFYTTGDKFPGSQLLSSLSLTQEDHVNMRERIRRILSNASTAHQGIVDAMNRCNLFDVVNETLAKRLVPYVALPRPWMTSLAEPVVRPRSTGSWLLLDIWSEIFKQIGDSGSLAMDQAQLQKSLDDLVSSDLYFRTHLFPSREVERAMERVGLALERWVLEDLLEDTVYSLRCWSCSYAKYSKCSIV